MRSAELCLRREARGERAGCAVRGSHSRTRAEEPGRKLASPIRGSLFWRTPCKFVTYCWPRMRAGASPLLWCRAVRGRSDPGGHQPRQRLVRGAPQREGAEPDRSAIDPRVSGRIGERDGRRGQPAVREGQQRKGHWIRHAELRGSAIHPEPGQSRAMALDYQFYQSKATVLGTNWTGDFVLEQLKILPSRQVRSVREFSVTFPGLTSDNGAGSTPPPETGRHHRQHQRHEVDRQALSQVISRPP